MDEAWERAVEAALDGQADSAAAPRTLTLDGEVKCLHGRLPPPSLLEKFQSLEHLSIANVGVSSLETFPRLRNLQRLILSDNRIAGGLEFLVEAGLGSLRDLDLSNNRIQFLRDLAPLAQLRLVSLDLYECPVTRIKDYRPKVFGLIRSLKYLDKMDADEIERPETEDEEEEDDDDDEEDDDPGSGEIDGEERVGKTINGAGGSTSAMGGGFLDVDEDEESDADEETTETDGRVEANGSDRGLHHHLSNGFRVAAAGTGQGEDEEEEEEEYVEDDYDEEDLGEEINEEEGGEKVVTEINEIEDSDQEDGLEEEEEDDADEDEEEEDVEDEEVGEPGSTGRLMSREGEIDGHEQGEEDENGEIGEEDEQGVEEERQYEDDDSDDEEEDFETDYLVQPIRQPENGTRGSDLDAGNEDESEEEEVDDDEEDHRSHGVPSHPSSSHPSKREDEEVDDDDDEDHCSHGVPLHPSSSHPSKRRRDEDDDNVEDSKSSKHQ